MLQQGTSVHAEFLFDLSVAVFRSDVEHIENAWHLVF
jgi:hypothetical protein